MQSIRWDVFFYNVLKRSVAQNFDLGPGSSFKLCRKFMNIFLHYLFEFLITYCDANYNIIDTSVALILSFNLTC